MKKILDTEDPGVAFATPPEGLMTVKYCLDTIGILNGSGYCLVRRIESHALLDVLKKDPKNEKLDLSSIDFENKIQDFGISPKATLEEMWRAKDKWRYVLPQLFSICCPYGFTGGSAVSSLLRRHWTWSWAEVLYAVRIALLDDSQSCTFLPEVLSGTMRIDSARAGREYVVISEPYFRSPSRYGGLSNNNRIVRKALQGYEDFLFGLGTVPLLEPHLIELMVDPLAIGNYRYKRQQLQNIIQDIEALSFESSKYSGFDFRILKMGCILANALSNKKLNLKFDSAKEKERMLVVLNGPNPQTIALQCLDNSVKLGRPEQSSRQAKKVSKIIIAQNLSGREHSEIETTISKICQRYGESKNSQTLTSFLVLRNWLNKNFGALIGTDFFKILEADNIAKFRFEFIKRILRWITQITFSDNAKITWYQKTTGHLEKEVSFQYSCHDDVIGVGSKQAIEKYHSMSAPLRLFNAEWGQITIYRKDSSFVEGDEIDLLRHVCELIGPFFHQQFLYSATLYLADRNLTGAQTTDLNPVATLLKSVFIVDGVSIWIRDIIESDKFYCKGFASGGGQSIVPYSGKSITRGENKRTSIAINMIESGAFWKSGQFGKGEFAGKWLEKPHTRALKNAGFKYIAIFPIYSGNEGIGFVSLYNKSVEISTDWIPWARFVSDYLRSTISEVFDRAGLEIVEKDLIIHETKNSIDAVARAVENLRKRLNKESEPGPQVLHSLGDIETHLADASEQISVWSDKDQVATNRRRDFLMIAMAKRRAADSRDYSVDIRDLVNQEIHNLTGTSRKRIDFSVNYSELDFCLEIPPFNARIIFNNLLSNAVKYARISSVIRIRCTEERFVMRVTFQNQGAVYTDDEITRLFDFQFRTHRAIAGNIPGKGMGLYVARKVCEIHEIELYYEVNPIKTYGQAKKQNLGEKKYVWHTFVLEIPYDLISDNANE